VENIKRLIDGGSTISGAIKEALSQRELSISAFARKYERNENNMINVIAGARRPAPADVEALISEFGGTDIEWREMLHDAGAPAARAS
jgi:hypothetical protein